MFDGHDAGATHELLMRLLHAETEGDVIAALVEVGLWEEPAAWRLLGDRPDNYSIVGAQATIPEAALVEKITNAIDANLMLRVRGRGIDPKGADAPRSVRQAVALLFEDNPHAAYAGDIALWDDRKIREVAQATTSIALTGDRRSQINRKPNYPGVTILDFGEGQAPEAQPETLLSLDRSLKLSVNFQQGKFNMGGSAALRFCGDHHFQLILSRRAPQLAAHDGESSDWGFTLVRKDYHSGEKMSAYRYLAPVGAKAHPTLGSLLRIPAESLPIGPSGNDAYVLPVEWGTLIKLYQYQTPFVTQFGQSGGLRHQLDVWLPQLPLPVRLYECRWEGDERSAVWNLTGLSRRLSNAPGLAFRDSGTMTVDGQRITYQLFCLSEGNAKRYRGDHGVIVAFNGQAHGTMHFRLFSRKRVGLGPLRDDLAVVVDCSQLDVPHFEDLTSNSRDRLSDSVFRRNLEAQVEEMLAEHPDLARLSREKGDKRLQESLTDQRPFEDVLKDIMRRSTALNALFLLGQRLPSQRVLQPTPVTQKHNGKPHPTEFHFRGLEPGVVLSRACHLEQRLRIDFETDVESGYFTRAAYPGTLTLELRLNGAPVPDGLYSSRMNLHDGYGHLNLTLPTSSEAGDRLEVVAIVSDETIEPFRNEAQIQVLPPQRKASTRPGKRSTRPSAAEGEKLALRPAGVEFPTIEPISREAWAEYGMDAYSALRIEDLGRAEAAGPQRYRFNVNVDNDYLLAEQRLNPALSEIAKAQWMYGLTLVGLGLLRDVEGHGFAETGEVPNESDEDRVARVTDSIGPVLLPMIRNLGALSQDDLHEELV